MCHHLTTGPCQHPDLNNEVCFPFILANDTVTLVCPPSTYNCGSRPTRTEPSKQSISYHNISNLLCVYLLQTHVFNYYISIIIHLFCRISSGPAPTRSQFASRSRTPVHSTTPSASRTPGSSTTPSASRTPATRPSNSPSTSRQPRMFPTEIWVKLLVTHEHRQITLNKADMGNALMQAGLTKEQIDTQRIYWEKIGNMGFTFKDDVDTICRLIRLNAFVLTSYWDGKVTYLYRCQGDVQARLGRPGTAITLIGPPGGLRLD